MLFKRFSFYLALAGLVGTGMLLSKMRRVAPTPPPLAQPSRSPFGSAVAATGIIEASRENVKIAVPKPGLVRRVYVSVGSRVKEGDPLVLLDDREARARVDAARAKVAALEAVVATEEVLAQDMEDQYQRVSLLEKSRVASEDERRRKEFAVKALKARVAQAGAEVSSMRALLVQSETELETLTVRAPRDGVILQCAIRAGEHAGGGDGGDAMMVLGDVDRLQVRAEVDEQNAPLVQPGQGGMAFLKGNSASKMALRFVRIEPFVVPKRSLTGDSTERVDTRVLQVIFEFDRPEFLVYVGQQVDVFIQR